MLNPQGMISSFFSIPLRDWCLVNLKCQKEAGDGLIWAEKICNYLLGFVEVAQSGDI